MSVPPPSEMPPSGTRPDPTVAGSSRWFETSGAPRELKPVVLLLAVNLTLSVVLTVVTLLFHQSLIDYQLDHRHITDPEIREALQHSYSGTLIIRAIGNVVISVVYAFLVRALFRGRRWAYRRVIYLSGFGILALILLQVQPYPVWMHVEQLVQAVVLALILYFVLRPAVRAHFDPRLPDRTVGRFGR